MVNKKAVIACTIVALVVVIAIVAINIRKFNEIDYAEVETSVNTETNEIINDIEENLVEEEITEDNEIIEKNSGSSEETSYQGEEEVLEETNSEETALELAKKEWGEDDSVYYTVDNQSGNIYYISVRDKSTTASLVEYKVNPSTGEVSDY